MLDYGHFLFAPPPRTGSTWFRRAAQLCRIPNGVCGLSEDPFWLHQPFVRPFDPPYERSARVTLVRHPADWISSYYSRLRRARLGLASDALADVAPTASFEEFVDLVIEHEPGIVGRVFNQYHEADIRLRTDRLNVEFEAFALSMGAPRDQAGNARSMPRENATDLCRGGDEPWPVRWDPVRRQRFLDSEQACLQQYGFV